MTFSAQNRKMAALRFDTEVGQVPNGAYMTPPGIFALTVNSRLHAESHTKAMLRPKIAIRRDVMHQLGWGDFTRYFDYH